MLTPATSASSTSAPSVIILKARSTQVTPCSSFERLPFEDATTHGLTPLGVITGRRLSEERLGGGGGGNASGGGRPNEIAAIQFLHRSSHLVIG